MSYCTNNIVNNINNIVNELETIKKKIVLNCLDEEPVNKLIEENENNDNSNLKIKEKSKNIIFKNIYYNLENTIDLLSLLNKKTNEEQKQHIDEIAKELENVQNLFLQTMIVRSLMNNQT